MRAIAARLPPESDTVSEYLDYCLHHPQLAKDFCEAIRHPAWIGWMTDKGYLNAFFADSEDEPNNNYNPKLHIPSTWEPPRASNDIERRMDAFEQKLEQIACENQRKKKQSSNITRKQWAMIKYLRQNDDFMIIPTDKNLGPAIIERSTYIERAWSEHLSDPNTYEVISPCKVDALKSEMRYLISAFHSKCFRARLPSDQLTFLSRLKNECSDNLISKFYT